MTPAVTRLRPALVALVAAATLLAPASARAQTWGQFGVDVLPLPVGNYSFWYGGVVNDAGQVAGSRRTGSIFEAFLFDAGAATPVQGLGTLGGAESRAYGINNLGQVTGYSRNTAGRDEAFLSDGPGTAMQGLGALTPTGFSAGFAINDAGQVGGYGLNSSGLAEPFLHDGSSIQGLGLLATGRSSYARGINEAGQVTGYGFNHAGRSEAFLSNGPGSAVQGLGALAPTGFSIGYAINESGQVVGESQNTAGQVQAFLSDGPGTTMQGLDMMGGVTTQARGISDAGQVVGYAGGGSIGGGRAALWEGGVGYFLDALDPFAGSGWTFYQALGMSGAGTVLVYGVNAAVNGGAGTYAVLRQLDDPDMAVVPEPSTWLLLATGLAGIGVAARRRREREGTEA